MSITRRTIDVKQLVCDAIGEAMGKDYFPGATGEHNNTLAALDSWKLVDVGRDVFDTNKVDNFTKAIAIKVAKVAVDSRLLELDIPSILKDSWEYGGYRENIRLGLYEVVDDPMYDLVNGTSYADIEHKFYAPTTYVKLFDELKSVMIGYSNESDVIKEAFTSWENMEKYVNGRMIAAKNTLTQIYKQYTKMQMACAIAITDKATTTARHMLTEAIALGLLSSGATVDDFIADKDCMLFLYREMKKTKQRFKEMTVAFNNKSIPTFTPSSDVETVILADIEAAFETTNAQIFHGDKLSLGTYDVVSAWQGINDGTSYFDFDTNATINLSADATNKIGIGTSGYESGPVAAFMFDTLAIGISPSKEKSTSSYTACADFWNTFVHVTTNRWVDSSYNMVAFILD